MVWRCAFVQTVILLMVGMSSFAAALPDQGDWQTINVEDSQVPVVYISAMAKKKGALILIQGKEERGYETAIIDYLRHKLPELGWSTLGINIPNQQTTSKWLAPEKQLSQSVLLLKNKGHKSIYVLLKGADAAALLTSFINQKVRDINGIILLSGYTAKRENYQELVKNIKTWRVFVFDIKAQYDYQKIEKDFALRDKIFDEVPAYHRAFTLPGAAHNYMDSKSDLARWLHGWMSRFSNQAPIVNRPGNIKQIPLNKAS